MAVTARPSSRAKGAGGAGGGRQAEVKSERGAGQTRWSPDEGEGWKGVDRRLESRDQQANTGTCVCLCVWGGDRRLELCVGSRRYDLVFAASPPCQCDKNLRSEATATPVSRCGLSPPNTLRPKCIMRVTKRETTNLPGKPKASNSLGGARRIQESGMSDRVWRRL